MTSSAIMHQAQPETVALFISDLHLQESMPHTTQAFFDFLQNHAVKAKQLYVLGDLFEYWAGDDDIAAPYNQRVVDALRRIGDTGTALFWIAGNRDFLVGKGFARATGITLLPDPYVTTIAGQRLVLAHGDAQCTDDIDYMTFRAQVRQAAWQQAFLAMPLAQRKSIIDGMRDGSRAAQRDKSYEIMDVNTNAITTLFDASDASLMIHGHTHRPARHVHRENGKDRIRYVLPDWDCDDEPVRGGWLAMDANGAIDRYAVDGMKLR